MALPRNAVFIAIDLARASRRTMTNPWLVAHDAERLARLCAQTIKVSTRRRESAWTEDDEAKATKSFARILRKAATVLYPYGGTDIRIRHFSDVSGLEWRIDGEKGGHVG